MQSCPRPSPPHARYVRTLRQVSRIMNLRKFHSPILLSFAAAAAWAQQPFVPQVIATPGSPSSVLYGLYHGNLVRSSDLGSTWIPLYITAAGLPQPPVQGFEINKLNANILYLATTMAA